MIRGVLKPPALKPGDTIGAIAPSSHIGDDRLATGMAFFEKHGYTVRLHEQVAARHGQFVGDEATRRAALHDVIADPSIHAIIGTHGGNGSGHLLEGLDYDLIAAHPKIIMGFSDITALIGGVNAQTGLITFHGPTLSRIGAMDDVYTHQCLSLLGGDITAPLPLGRVLRAGVAEGPLVGGNLSVLQTLIGTPFAPPLKGALLFIEDYGDHLSRYDRMLGHMKRAGWFDQIGGLIIGEFINSQDNKDRPFGFTIEQRIMTLTDGYNFPVTIDAPVGHGDHLLTFALGCRARMDNGQLHWLESPVAI